MTAGLYRRARIDRRTIRRYDVDNVDTPIDLTSLAYAVFAPLAATALLCSREPRVELWRHALRSLRGCCGRRAAAAATRC